MEHLESGRARLIAASGPMRGEVLTLAERVTTIGRDTGNGICLADLALSRSHCAITFDEGAWRISDLKSSNGTFVNGAQVGEHDLADGDRIGLGESVFLFVTDGAAPSIVESPAEARHCVARVAVADTEYLSPEHRPVSRVERDLRALLRISNTLNAVATEDDLYRELVELVAATLLADQVAVIVVDPDGETKVAAASRRDGPAAATFSRTIVQQCITERTALLTRDADPELLKEARSIVSAGVQAALSVAMVARNRVLGALYLANTNSPDAFSHDDLPLVSAIANVAAAAIDNVRHVEWLRRETERLQSDLHGDRMMVGSSSAMKRIYETVAKVARADATTVLITGETGTGKELVARSVHLNSPRARRAFVAVNCAALTETLLETELFGHERGAFTGAVAQKKGKLEIADGGTLLLDEVGELAPALQSKLLRALQEREFERVGGTRPVRFDVRVIAATNRDLGADVMAGRFRRDLYHRLNVVEVHVPPLRDRREDIPPLANHFVSRFGRRAPRPVIAISPHAMTYLTAYEWPGNVRELENTIERAVVLGASEYVLPEDLPETLLDGASAGASALPRFHEAVRQTKEHAIVEAFRDAGGSYAETARLLGLHPNYLHRLIRQLDIKSVLEGSR